MKLWPSHWWFSDIMSPKHDHANYDQFIPNFNMVCDAKVLAKRQFNSYFLAFQLVKV